MSKAYCIYDYHRPISRGPLTCLGLCVRPSLLVMDSKQISWSNHIQRTQILFQNLKNQNLRLGAIHLWRSQ